MCERMYTKEGILTHLKRCNWAKKKWIMRGPPDKVNDPDTENKLD